MTTNQRMPDHSTGLVQVLQTQLSLLETLVTCAEGDEKFDESKVKRAAGGKFGSKPDVPPEPKSVASKPQVPPDVLEKQRQLKEKVETVIRSVRESAFGKDAIARLQYISGSFKKSLDANAIFRHAQVAIQEFQVHESLDKVLESAMSQYRDLTEQVGKGKCAEEVAGTVSATSSVIGGIVASLHGKEALAKVSELFKQKEVSLKLDDIAGAGKPLGSFQDVTETVASLKQVAVDTVNSSTQNNKPLI